MAYQYRKEFKDDMKISGTTAWGEVWTITKGEPGTMKEEFVGFVLSEEEASLIVTALN